MEAYNQNDEVHYVRNFSITCYKILILLQVTVSVFQAFENYLCTEKLCRQKSIKISY